MAQRRADMNDMDALLEQANAVLADMSGQYPATALRAIGRAEEILSAPCVSDAAVRDDFFPIAHNIKGQGATFQYPLLTDIGAFLCAYIRARKKFDARDVALFRRYVGEMRAIVERRLTGDGGAFGRKLRAQLKKEAA